MPEALRRAETDALFATVEDVRARSYPDVPADLVAQVLHIQYLHAEDRGEARKLTEQVISRWADANSDRGK